MKANMSSSTSKANAVVQNTARLTRTLNDLRCDLRSTQAKGFSESSMQLCQLDQSECPTERVLFRYEIC